MSGLDGLRALNLASGRTRSMLITLGFVVLALLVGYFVAWPLHGRIAQLEQAIKEADGAIGAMRSVIAGAGKIEEGIEEGLAALRRGHGEGVLVPYRNSYEMAARQLVAPVVQRVGVRLVGVRELPALGLQHDVELPPVHGGYQRQPVEFTVEGSYWEICDFVREVVVGQGLVGLHGLSIKSQGQSPEEHRGVVSFEWPSPVDVGAMEGVVGVASVAGVAGVAGVVGGAGGDDALPAREWWVADGLRDPFWPVGYAPAQPEPEPEEVVEVAEPPPALVVKPPPAPKVVPVSEQEWVEAGKGLKVNGYARATRGGQGESTAIVMINGRSFASGESVVLTNRAVYFEWRIEQVTDRDMELVRVKAERLKQLKRLE